MKQKTLTLRYVKENRHQGFLNEYTVVMDFRHGDTVVISILKRYGVHNRTAIPVARKITQQAEVNSYLTRFFARKGIELTLQIGENVLVEAS